MQTATILLQHKHASERLESAAGILVPGVVTAVVKYAGCNALCEDFVHVAHPWFVGKRGTCMRETVPPYVILTWYQPKPNADAYICFYFPHDAIQSR